MRTIPVFYLAITLILTLAVGVRAVSAQTEPPLKEASVEMQAPAKDPLVLELEALKWDSMPKGARNLTFEEVLKRTVKENLDIQLAREKVNETGAKQDGVESKRLLFFFKYFNSDYIEGAAESDVHAAATHVAVETHEALMQAARNYYDLVRAEMAGYLAFRDIQQGLKQLQLDQRQFQAGNSTSFLLMQTRTRLLQQYEDYLKAGSTRRNASLQLAQFLGMNVERSIYPAELDYKDTQLELPVLALIAPETLAGKELGAESLRMETVVEQALKHRPDLKELEYKKESVRNLIKANEANFDRSQVKIMKSTLQQLELKCEKARQVIAATAAKAFHDYQFALQKMELSNRQLTLASTVLRQVRISHKAGLSSEKDVLDTQVAFAQAQVKQANAIIDFNLSQVQLLYETGLISVDTLLESSPETFKTISQKAEPFSP